MMLRESTRTEHTTHGANFNLLVSSGIDPVIKVRKNASRKARGSYARKVSVIAQQTNLEGWKKGKKYGDRWAVEGAYSAIKRRSS